MSAILRNNAATAHQQTTGARLGGGGSGRGPIGGPAPKKVDPKYHHAKDPAAELMPAAEFLGVEPDVQAILEDFEGSPFDPKERKVLGTLMGVFAMDYQGARAEERKFLRRLLAARNAREGYAANRALHLLGVANVIRRTLALGVAEARRQSGPVFGFLGAVQARVAATTFRLLGPEARELVWNLLTLAGTDERKRPIAGADRVLERALVLKALAARRHLLGPWSGAGAQALFEIEQFAAAIRGASRQVLATGTTLREVDEGTLPRVVTSGSGIVRAQMVARSEIDPVFAWNEHGIKAKRVAQEEGADGEDGLPDLDRSPLLDRPRLHQALAEARLHGDRYLPADLGDALTDYLSGRALLASRLAKKEQALAILWKRGFDVARVASIEAIREDARGVYTFDAARALGDLLSRYSGATYVRRVFSDQTTAARDPLGQIRVALEQGLSVPMLIAELKVPLVRSLVASRWREDAGTPPRLSISIPQQPASFDVAAAAMLAPTLPEPLGRRARAEAFFLPAALDLIAPPFGLPFVSLGLEDRL